MHPPLTIHRHLMCAEIIEAFQKCHTDHPVKKFFGECTDLKVKLDRCFREEKAIKRKANFEESKKFKEKLQAYRKELSEQEKESATLKDQILVAYKLPLPILFSELRLDELGDLSAPNPSFRNLILELEGFHGLAETPVFTIQVTKFRCGSFSIGFAMNHIMLDGRSAAEFFQKLAAICRGDETVSNSCGLNTDRSCIKARNPLQIKFDHTEYTEQTFSNFTTPTSQTKSTPSLSDLNDAPQFKRVSLDSNFIATLKEKASIKCSSFEAVVAHLWKSRARAFYDDPTKVSSVLFAVDIRGKMVPPLPDGFVGNAVITASASAVVEDLLVKPFSFCVEMVKEGIQKVTNEYVRSAIDWWEMHRGVPSIIDGNFFVSAWWKLPFHELDFGRGRPVYAGPLVTGMHEFVLLLPGKNGDGISVWIALDRNKMKRFMSYVLEL